MSEKGQLRLILFPAYNGALHFSQLLYLVTKTERLACSQD